MDAAQKAEIIAQRDADWNALVAELTAVRAIFLAQPQLEEAFHSMFNAAWVMGSKAGISMAQVVMRSAL